MYLIQYLNDLLNHCSTAAMFPVYFFMYCFLPWLFTLLGAPVSNLYIACLHRFGVLGLLYTCLLITVEYKSLLFRTLLYHGLFTLTNQFVPGHNVSVENTYAWIVCDMMRQKTSVNGCSKHWMVQVLPLKPQPMLHDRTSILGLFLWTAPATWHLLGAFQIKKTRMVLL